MSGSDPDEIDPRLIPLALGAWASAWWGTSPAWPGALGILAALTLAGLWMVRRGSLPAATALVGVVLVCGLAALARHHQLVTSSPAELASQHAMVDVVVRIEGDPVVRPLTMESSVADLLADPVAGPVAREAMAAVFGGGVGMDAAGASMMANDEAMMKMMASFPIGRLAAFPGFLCC